MTSYCIGHVVDLFGERLLMKQCITLLGLGYSAHLLLCDFKHGLLMSNHKTKIKILEGGWYSHLLISSF